MNKSKTQCRNGRNCPWCLMNTGKFELCESEILRDVKKLFRPFCYWVKKEKNTFGTEYYLLTIFHGGIRQSYSSGWKVKDLDNLRPTIAYLEEKKVEKGDDSLTI